MCSHRFDGIGELRFETEDGVALSIEPSSLQGEDGDRLFYNADTHYGSLKAPVVPTTNDELQTTKIIENDHVIIIRNGDKYDVNGRKLKK